MSTMSHGVQRGTRGKGSSDISLRRSLLLQTGTYADMQALLQRGGYIYLLVRGFLHAEVDSEGSGVGGNRGVCNIDTTF